MKTYELAQDWNGLPAKTQIFGPYPLLASSGMAYFRKEDIPQPGQHGTNGFFQSAVENNPTVFKEVVE